MKTPRNLRQPKPTAFSLNRHLPRLSLSRRWLRAGAGVWLLGLGGCVAVTQKPPLPQAEDFVLPKAEIYASYPALREYDVSATPWARELYLDVPHVVKNWGPPARQAMSWWTLGGLLIIRPAYWYWWDKGHYQVGLYYEKHLTNGWQPVGVRVELRETVPAPPPLAAPP